MKWMKQKINNFPYYVLKTSNMDFDLIEIGKYDDKNYNVSRETFLSNFMDTDKKFKTLNECKKYCEFKIKAIFRYIITDMNIIGK